MYTHDCVSYNRSGLSLSISDSNRISLEEQQRGREGGREGGREELLLLNCGVQTSSSLRL